MSTTCFHLILSINQGIKSNEKGLPSLLSFVYLKNALHRPFIWKGYNIHATHISFVSNVMISHNVIMDYLKSLIIVLQHSFKHFLNQESQRSYYGLKVIYIDTHSKCPEITSHESFWVVCSLDSLFPQFSTSLLVILRLCDIYSTNKLFLK